MSIDIFDLDGTLILGGSVRAFGTLNTRVLAMVRDSTASRCWCLSGRHPSGRAITEAMLSLAGLLARLSPVLLVGEDGTNDETSWSYKAPFLDAARSTGAPVRLIDDDPKVGEYAKSVGIEWVDARTLR